MFFLTFNNGEVENIIFNTRADFNVLKGFKTEYAIKKIFEFFFKKSMDSPLTFFELFTKIKYFLPAPTPLEKAIQIFLKKVRGESIYFLKKNSK